MESFMKKKKALHFLTGTVKQARNLETEVHTQRPSLTKCAQLNVFTFLMFFGGTMRPISQSHR